MLSGTVFDLGQGEAIAQWLGRTANVLFLRHHGVIVTGPTVAAAYTDAYLLERACRVQMIAPATGRPLRPGAGRCRAGVRCREMTTGEPPMNQVSYTRLKDMTKADAELSLAYEQEEAAGLADRILETLTAIDEFHGPVQVSGLEHSLQTATRALHDGMDEEYVVAALVHDIGDALAPYSHGEYVGAILKPFVSERICWVITHHPVFQAYYYVHLYGADRNARDRYRGHPYFDDCVRFCEKYDQESFDPNYPSLPLSFFEPMVRRVFGQPRYLPPEMQFLIGADQAELA